VLFGEAPAAARAEEPEPIPLHGSADRRRVVVDVECLVLGRQAAVAQGVGEIAALQRIVAVERGEVSRKDVPAFSRNDVHHRSVGIRLRGDAAGLEHHVLNRSRVHLIAAVARELHVVDAHAVERDLRAALAVIRAGAADPGAADLRGVGAGDGRQPRESGRQRDQRIEVLGAGGQRGEELTRRDRLPPNVLCVDQRTRACHGDRLLHAADREVRVDGRGEASRQLDALSGHGPKSRQPERHRIGARSQVDDAVASLAVGGHRPDLLDQRGACGFHGDAGKHGAGRIPHHSGDAARLLRLGQGRGREQDPCHQGYCRRGHFQHSAPPGSPRP
jgi:hypothetical protein